MKSSNSATRLLYRPRNSNEDRIQKNYELIPNRYSVLELEFERTKQESFDIYIYANAPTSEVDVGDSLEIDWIQITPIDNQHLVVEKTPLGNGMTRIQTWGGSSTVQLLLTSGNLGIDKLKNFTFSAYLENKGPEFDIWLPTGDQNSNCDRELLRPSYDI